jgi:hypothetical protein
MAAAIWVTSRAGVRERRVKAGPGTKRPMQPFDLGRLEHPARDLGGRDQRFGGLLAAMGPGALHRTDPALGVLFDHVHHMQVGPPHPRRTPALARWLRVTKHGQNGARPGHKAIDRPEQGLAQFCGSPHLADDFRDQSAIALRADRALAPQATEHTHRQGHPDVPALVLDIQLIAVHLAQVDRSVADHLGLHSLGVCSSFLEPGSHGAFIQREGGHDCWHGAAVGQQGEHHLDQPQGGLHAEQRAARGRRKGRLAGVTDVPSFGMGVDADATTCRAVRLGAYGLGRVEGGPLGCRVHTSEIPPSARSVTLSYPCALTLSQTIVNLYAC